MTSLVATFATLIIAGSVVFAGRAVAESGSSGWGTLFGTEIGANVLYGSPPREVNSCRWHHVVDIDTLTGVYGPISRVMGGDPYSLLERNCDGPPATTSQFWVRDDAHAELATRAADKAAALLPRPVFAMAPTPLQMVVNVGTWFWVSRSIWKPVSVTAYLPTPEGIVWVTTTATPTRLVYSPGDGTRRTISCIGPGRRWRTVDGDRRASTCMYTYAHATNGVLRRAYRARIGIEWRVTWESNLGASGVLPNARTSTPLVVRVHEIQALTTN